MVIYQIVNEYKKVDEVLAITLAGSGASGENDFFSDIDIDIILKYDIEMERKKEILRKFSDEIDITSGLHGRGNQFLLRNSTTKIDISYFVLDKLMENLSKIVDKHEASIGHSTCLWKNVTNAYVAYDKDSIFTKLQNKYRVSYPQKLKRNIIEKNYPILKDELNSCYKEIEKAISRADNISIYSNIEYFFRCYFDIIFAVNEILHPGDKRLLTIANKKCTKLPKGFNEGINNLLETRGIYDKNILKNIDSLVQELRRLLESEELLTS